MNKFTNSYVNTTDKHVLKQALFAFVLFLLVSIWAIQASAAVPEGVEVESAMLSSSMFAPVEKIMVRQGQEVKKGDILVSLECGSMNAKMKRANSILKSKKFSYLNKIKLREFDAASGLEVDLARADVEEAQANIDILKSDRRSCEIRSPFDGMVRAVMINPYETAREGQALVEVSRLNSEPIGTKSRSGALNDIQNRPALIKRDETPEIPELKAIGETQAGDEEEILAPTMDDKASPLGTSTVQ